MQSTVGMVSLGCAKNRVDAEMMLFTLRQAGFKIIPEAAMADIAIVNTCGFIEDAKKESIDEILELARLKSEGKIKGIIVTGCLAERYKEEVLKELYEVDAVVGIGCNAEIAKIAAEIVHGKKSGLHVGTKYDLPIEGGRIRSTPGYFAYLKIAEGCDNRCAYCAIPLIRGGFRSRKLENVVAEAKKLASDGVKELAVIAQDTTRYGEDIYGKPMLASLLKELCKIDGIEWIRILYCYPDRINDELLEVMAAEEKVLKYIDLPLQHCSGKILKAMNRRGDRESLTTLIKHIRDMVPGVVLRTTLIAGFPGETEEDFTELAEFVNDIKFERLGCFTYSREEDTPAYDMPDQIEEDVKQRRQEIIMQLQQEIAENYNRSLKGKTITVITEGYDRYAECWFGRSKADAPDVDGKVFFTVKEKKPHLGEFVEVEIYDFIDYDPIGMRVE